MIIFVFAMIPRVTDWLMAAGVEGIDAERAHRAVGRALAGGSGGGWLEAAAASELLGCYGIPHAPAQRVGSATAASRVAAELGFPVTLKVSGSLSGSLAIGVKS